MWLFLPFSLLVGICKEKDSGESSSFSFFFVGSYRECQEGEVVLGGCRVEGVIG